MKIELYVVQPYKNLAYLTFEEKTAIEQLEHLKVELCRGFGGLTEIPNCKGYWHESLDNGRLCLDNVNIWVIYSSTKNNPKRDKCKCTNSEQLDITTRINHTWLSYHVPHWRQLENIIKRVKAICNQKSQLFVINDKPFYI